MGLRRYVVRRLGQLVVTYWAFLTILFALFRLMPGDPTSIYGRNLPPDAREEMIDKMGLNDPLHIQYVDYMKQLVIDFSWGQSHIYREPVVNIVTIKFWNTIFLMIAALLIAYVVGIAFGVLMAWYRGGNFEIAGILLSLVARSIPVFFFGILLLMVFSFQLDLFPAGRMHPMTYNPETFWDRYLTWHFVYHAILPVFTGAFVYMGTPMLLMRNSMLEVLNADFISTKRAEGLSEFNIMFRHAARNSALPIVTVFAIVMGTAIGGQVLIEVVFNWPGMGRAMVEAVQSNDYPLAQALFFLMGSVVIFMNLLADITYAYLDPRVTYD